MYFSSKNCFFFKWFCVHFYSNFFLYCIFSLSLSVNTNSPAPMIFLSRCLSLSQRWELVWPCTLSPWMSPWWTDLSLTCSSASSWRPCLGKSSASVTRLLIPEIYGAAGIVLTFSAKLSWCPSLWLPASSDDLSVSLQPVSRQGERRTATLQGGGDALSFSFDNVLPGKYKGLPAFTRKPCSKKM